MKLYNVMKVSKEAGPWKLMEGQWSPDEMGMHILAGDLNHDDHVDTYVVVSMTVEVES